MKPLAQLEEAFHDLVPLPEPQQRERLEALGRRDPAAATALRELLAAHARESQIDRPAQLGPEADQAPVARARPEDLIGRQIGRYRVLRHLGSGGMSDVFEAEQERPTRRVALKALRSSSAAEGSALRRFMLELETLAQLDHPHIASVYDGGFWPEPGAAWSAWIAMELVDEPLSILDFASRRALDREARIELVMPLLDAVHHAHRRGFLHRDLKPANLLASLARVDAGVKVIDFGLARALPGVSEELTRTRSGEILGTPLYMSPEQADGTRGGVDVRADVYALGILLFELLLGQHPIDVAGRTLGEIVAHIRAGRLQSPDRIDANIAPDLAAILERATQREADLRYDNVDALRADLGRFLASEPVHAHEVSTARRVRLFVRRHRTGVLLAGLCLVLGIAALTQILVLWNRSESALAKFHAEEERVRIARAELGDVKATLSDAAARVVARSSRAMSRAATRGESRRVVADAFGRLRALDPVLRRDTSSLGSLASAYAAIGDLHGTEWFARKEDVRVASEAYGQAVELRRAILAAEPQSQQARSELVRALVNYVQSLRKCGAVDRVFPADEAVVHARALSSSKPKVDAHLRLLLSALWARSDLAIESSRREQGMADAKAAVELARAEHETRSDWLEALAWAEFRYGTWCAYSSGLRAEALGLCRSAADRIVGYVRKTKSRDQELRLAVQTILGFEVDLLLERDRSTESFARAEVGMRLFETLGREAGGAMQVEEIETWSRFALQAMRAAATAEDRRRVATALQDMWRGVDAERLSQMLNPAGLGKAMIEIAGKIRGESEGEGEKQGIDVYRAVVTEGLRRLKLELPLAEDAERPDLEAQRKALEGLLRR